MFKQMVKVMFFCAMLIASTASAAMVGLSINDLTRSSDAVVKGSVEKSVTYWADDGKRIMTKAYVRVHEVIRGILPSRSMSLVPVEYEGGEIGDIGYRRADVTPLHVNDDVILFLKRQDSSATVSGVKSGSGSNGNIEDIHTIVGYGQGVYKINDGAATTSAASVVVNQRAVTSEVSVDTLIYMIKGVK